MKGLAIISMLFMWGGIATFFVGRRPGQSGTPAWLRTVIQVAGALVALAGFIGLASALR